MGHEILRAFRIWTVLLVIALLAAAGIVVSKKHARGETGHNHHLHHASYQSWVNKDSKGCCNNTDCGEIADSDEREISGHLHVLIRGVGAAKGQTAWCPVLSHHYLSRGNVPNAAVSHACVSAYYGGKTPCEQFVCFQPRPLS